VVARADLTRFLLEDADAPVGTQLDASSSGAQTLEQYAEDDAAKKQALADAGFETSFFRVFVSTEALARRKGAIAISFAILFREPDGARAGLRIIRESVERDGGGLSPRPAEGLGDDAFALAGTLEVGLLPGFLYAWRRGNLALGLIAAGPAGIIDESAARALAERMALRGG
jgi:hypothetical protein